MLNRKILALGVAAGAVLATSAVGAKTLKWSSQGDIVDARPIRAHGELHRQRPASHLRAPGAPQLQARDRAGAGHFLEGRRAQSVAFHAAAGGQVPRRRAVHRRRRRRVDRAQDSIRIRGRAAILPNVERAEKVDDFTVDFVLKGPYPLLLNDLSGFFIMSKKWMEANNALKPGNTTTGTTTFASTNANGTGPFKLESYRPDVGTNLVVNESWWDKAAAQSHAHRIQADQVGRDARRGAAVRRDRHDGAGAAAGPARIADAGLKVVEEPSLRVIFLGLNLRPELLATPGQKNPMLDAACDRRCGRRSTSTRSRSA